MFSGQSVSDTNSSGRILELNTSPWVGFMDVVGGDVVVDVVTIPADTKSPCDPKTLVLF